MIANDKLVNDFSREEDVMEDEENELTLDQYFDKMNVNKKLNLKIVNKLEESQASQRYTKPIGTEEDDQQFY